MYLIKSLIILKDNSRAVLGLQIMGNGYKSQNYYLIAKSACNLKKDININIYFHTCFPTRYIWKAVFTLYIKGVTQNMKKDIGNMN